MTLRDAVAGVAAILFALALAGVAFDVTRWPLLIPMGLLLTGTLFERARYGGAGSMPAEPGWVRTNEQFIDDASGRVMTVWFNPTTGQRRYVDGQGAPSGRP